MIFRFKRLPQKHDWRWFLMIPVMAALIMVVMGASSYFILDLRASSTDLFIFGLLALIEAGVVCGLLYSGLRIAGGISLTGVILSLIAMIYVFLQPIEYRGLVGLVTGIELAFVCLLIGINIQLLNYLIQKRKK